MSATVSTDLLLQFLHATAEKQAAIARLLAEPEGAAAGSTEDRESGRPRYRFRRIGRRHWLVVFAGGEEFILENTLGARYLDYLLHHPNEVVRVEDLEVAVLPEKAGARAQNSIQGKPDGDAVRRCLRELERLRAAEEVARSEGNLGAAEQAGEEIEALERWLKQGVGSSDTRERARGNVSKAVASVRRVLARGSRAEKLFEEHIQKHISLGYDCVYQQPEGRIWG